MADKTSERSCRENAISQWKIDLVGTFFHKQGKPAAGKQALVFEDCDISSICVSHDDTTENCYEDHEGTLTSSPVCKSLILPSSLGRVPASCAGNSWNKLGEINNQKLSSEELSPNHVDIKIASIKQEDSSTGVSVENPEIILSPVIQIKSSASFLSVPPISARENIDNGFCALNQEISHLEPVSPTLSSSVTSTHSIIRPPVPPSLTQIGNSTSDSKKTETISSASSLLTGECGGQERKSPSRLGSVVPIPSTAGLVSTSKQISNVQDAQSEEMNIPSVRPILLNKSSTAPKMTDQGRNCVSVVLKSSRLDPKAARLHTIAKRQEKVEQLVSRYSLKFGHKSSPGVQVRLDYCFNKPAEARQFFIAVHDLEQSKSPPKFLSCFLLSEIDLGYEHEPVLTEYDLLAIQLPYYCRNVFRTPILIKVVQEGEMVLFRFKTVADVNRFLFNKSGSKTIRSLGQLRMNPVNNKMIPDQDGLFSLFTEERQICQKFGEKHKFTIKPKMEYGEDASLLGGNLLLFSTKLDLFKFLFSEDAAELDHLQFLKSKIVNCPDPKKIVEKDAIVFIKYSEELLNKSGRHETDKKIKDEAKKDALKQEEKVKVPIMNYEVESIKPGGDGVDIKINVKDEIMWNDLHNKGLIQLEAAGKDPAEVKQGVTHDALPCSEIINAEGPVKVEICSEEVARNFTPRCCKSSNQCYLPKAKVPAEISAGNKSDEKVREDDSSIERILAQKDDEIIRLKEKLKAKEKVIETEIQSKIAVKSELKEACMQLEKIHNLSLSLHGKMASGN